jgi:sRNA-binding carbon storage regulator CsrA
MLVATRKEGERIVIGDDTVITVVEARPGSVRWN